MRLFEARFARQLPGSRTVLVPGAHHFIFLSNPEETYVTVAAFLADTDRR